ncbi:hypothetical protein H920_00717 [Fukomys damarensis]|uniref:Uncharacterized protein n=1 Tax=Fukomys damarensis TaxID=885580 RepID=A0A091E3J4_FUKDA|nr:hypothetical protein H920_00717 [Fukomys damarensis]
MQGMGEDVLAGCVGCSRGPVLAKQAVSHGGTLSSSREPVEGSNYGWAQNHLDAALVLSALSSS